MRKLPLMFLLVAPALAGCEDPLEPRPWSDEPTEAQLWSIDRPELMGLPSAFDFTLGRSIVLEDPDASANWDVALTDTEDGLAFTPAGAFPDIDSEPAVAVITGTSFEDLLEAPGDLDTYVRTEPVPLVAGGVYVVRSRRIGCSIFVGSGHMYSKLRVLELNPDEGTVRFEFVTNLNCNDRSFVPPESDD
ncbi:MAG TPA: hypothetical protein VF212_08880 [Longimicrobiales bacterium]